jgi:hypothetical protein
MVQVGLVKSFYNKNVRLAILMKPAFGNTLLLYKMCNDSVRVLALALEVRGLLLGVTRF